MKITPSLAGLGLAFAGFVVITFVPAKSVRAADDGQETPGFHREVAGNRLISIKPLVEPVPEPRPVRRISEEDIRRRQMEQARPGFARLPERNERDLERDAASDRRPVRLPDAYLHRAGEESNRSGLRLIHRPEPGQGVDEVEVVR